MPNDVMEPVTQEQQNGTQEPAAETEESGTGPQAPVQAGLHRPRTQRKPPNKRRRKIITRSILALVILGALTGASIAVYNVFLKPKDIFYATEAVYMGMLESTATGWGQVKPAESADIAVKQSGKILESFFEEGDQVAKGDLLFTMDTALLDESIKELEKEIQELEDTNAELLESINKELAEASVHAPFSGKLVGMENPNMTVGDVLPGNTTLGLLADDSKMLLTLYYSYAYEHDIKAGMSAQVAIPSSMSIVDATVSRVEKIKKITPEGTILFEVEFSMNNPGALTKDMMATALISTSSGEEIVPAEAGKLRYAKEQVLTLGTGGRLVLFNMHEYYTYTEGSLLCQVEYNTDMSRVEANNAAIAKNREKIAEETKKYDDYSIYSPIDGTIMYNKLIAGETEQPGQAVISVAQLSNMVVEAQIDERNIYGIEVGMPVMLEQWTDTGSYMFSGTVQSVSLEAKNDSGWTYFPAIISVDNYDGNLRPNMGVNFTVTLNRVFDVLIAPVNAIKLTPAGQTVFLKADSPPDNIAELPQEILDVVPPGFYPVTVETGLGTTQGVEIISGVNEGDELFTQELDYDPMAAEGAPGGKGGTGMVVRVG